MLDRNERLEREDLRRNQLRVRRAAFILHASLIRSTLTWAYFLLICFRTNYATWSLSFKNNGVVKVTDTVMMMVSTTMSTLISFDLTPSRNKVWRALVGAAEQLTDRQMRRALFDAIAAAVETGLVHEYTDPAVQEVRAFLRNLISVDSRIVVNFGTDLTLRVIDVDSQKPYPYQVEVNNGDMPKRFVVHFVSRAFTQRI